MGDYRRLTLMPTLYKVYMMVLAETKRGNGKKWDSSAELNRF